MKHQIKRLYFWDANRSCYVVTNRPDLAIKEMDKESEYSSHAIATSQSEEISFDDREMYFDKSGNLLAAKKPAKWIKMDWDIGEEDSNY